MMLKHFQGSHAVATVDALESIGRHLSGVQNRKNLIWVSSGFPLEAFGYRGRSKTREINGAISRGSVRRQATGIDRVRHCSGEALRGWPDSPETTSLS